MTFCARQNCQCHDFRQRWRFWRAGSLSLSQESRWFGEVWSIGFSSHKVFILSFQQLPRGSKESTSGRPFQLAVLCYLTQFSWTKHSKQAYLNSKKTSYLRGGKSPTISSVYPSSSFGSACAISPATTINARSFMLEICSHIFSTWSTSSSHTVPWFFLCGDRS